MSTQNEQVVIVIIAVTLTLLFLGILFLVMVVFYSNKRKKMNIEKQALLEEFEKLMLQTKLEIQEQTFNEISEEIHDNVGQILSLAKVQLSLLHEGNRFDSGLILVAKESISKAMAELRDIAKSLNTERAKNLNLVESIQEEVQRFNKTGVISASIEQEGSEDMILDDHKLILFRVIQEGLHNIVKHAGATKVVLKFVSCEGAIKISISDNGNGFDVNELANSNRGMGLKNMQRRVELIGGQFKVQSVIGQGTAILLIINPA